MKLEAIEEAAKAAEEFLSRVSAFRQRIEDEKAYCEKYDRPLYYATANGTKESSAVRRSSMDLTRALTAMRKSS